MPEKKRPDPKLEALRQQGTLHRTPGKVTDELFGLSEFFDPRDILQVKYEMIRRVQVDRAPVSQTARTFGFSRPSFYEARAAFGRGGLAGLLPRKRGPRGPHKLELDVMAFIQEIRTGGPVSAAALVPLIQERFGLRVHPRSIERALAREEKKRR